MDWEHHRSTDFAYGDNPKWRYAAVLRFEACLCVDRRRKQPSNLIYFPKLQQYSPDSSELSYLKQPIGHYSPGEYERMVRQQSEQWRWSNGAIWFVRSLSHYQDTRIFLLSELVEPIVEKKSKSALVEAEIVASKISYRPVSGLYESISRIDRLGRAEFLAGLIDSNRFKQVFYVGIEEDLDLVDERAISIILGRGRQPSRPAQFAVKNFMEASSAMNLVRCSNQP